MARTYSRKKGKSGSTKPVGIDNKSWTATDQKSLQTTIVDLAKTGKTASEIGMILRDMHSYPDVKALTGKRISHFLREAKLTGEVPDDLLALIRRDIALEKHRETNHKDMTAKRGQQLTLGKINRLVSYYKKTNVLAADWTYDRKKAVQWVI